MGLTLLEQGTGKISANSKLSSTASYPTNTYQAHSPIYKNF